MKTFPIALASAAIGLSLVAGGFRSATAEESAAGPEDTCVYVRAGGIAACKTYDAEDTTWIPCPSNYNPPEDNRIPVGLAEAMCGAKITNTTGTP